MLRIILTSVLTILLSNCRQKSDYSNDLATHDFDNDIIRDLPLYDTLRQLLIQNISEFQLNDTNQSFKYLNFFDTSQQSLDDYSNKDLPSCIYPTTERLFNKIGKRNIFGFSISRDSTLSIFLRNSYLAQYHLDVRERLHWHPSGKLINNISLSAKDTLLTANWRYEVWYDERAEF